MGRRAEGIVARLLEQRGYTVLARNARVGRLELDLVARRKHVLVVCEVRARRNACFMHPIESIDPKKVERIRRATVAWLQKERPGTTCVRFDAASVVFDTPEGRLTYFEDAF